MGSSVRGKKWVDSASFGLYTHELELDGLDTFAMACAVFAFIFIDMPNPVLNAAWFVLPLCWFFISRGPAPNQSHSTITLTPIFAKLRIPTVYKYELSACAAIWGSLFSFNFYCIDFMRGVMRHNGALIGDTLDPVPLQWIRLVAQLLVYGGIAFTVVAPITGVFLMLANGSRHQERPHTE